MDYRKKFLVEPGQKVKLDDLDPGCTGKHTSEDRARDEIEKSRREMAAQQYLLYAEKKHALLIVLQGMDAAGKDGTVSHVMSAMNPRGTIVGSFKEPQLSIWSMTSSAGASAHSGQRHCCNLQSFAL